MTHFQLVFSFFVGLTGSGDSEEVVEVVADVIGVISGGTTMGEV
jgi:hypothetical protein